MLSKSKIMTVLVVFSLVLVFSMGFLETRMIRSYFLDYSIEQVKYTVEQLVSPLAELNISPADEDSLELANWIFYNTGLRVLLTDSEGAIVVDSSEEGSLIGQNIEEKSLETTMQDGEIGSFKMPSAGEGQIAISAPWRTGEAISGAIVLVGPLETYAKQGTDELSPFFRKAGLATLLIAIVGSFILSERLYKQGERGSGYPSSSLVAKVPDETTEEKEGEHIVESNQEVHEETSENEDAQKTEAESPDEDLPMQ